MYVCILFFFFLFLLKYHLMQKGTLSIMVQYHFKIPACRLSENKSSLFEILMWHLLLGLGSKDVRYDMITLRVCVIKVITCLNYYFFFNYSTILELLIAYIFFFSYMIYPVYFRLQQKFLFNLFNNFWNIYNNFKIFVDTFLSFLSLNINFILYNNNTYSSW